MKNKLLIILLTGLLLTGCGQKASSPKSEIDITSETSTAEAQAPYVLTFEASTIDGQEITSDIFADSKLTMLNAWATYCNPCLNEMPYLGEIATQYEKGTFQMVGIICDVTSESSADDLSDAKALIQDTKADTYPHILLNESLYYNLVCASDSVPTTYFVNQKGELVGYLVGAQSKENWISIIESLLSETGE